LTAKAGSTAALAPNFDLAAAPASAPGGDAPGSAGNGNSANAPGSAANGPAVPGSGLSVLLAPSIRTLASAATSIGAPAAPQGSAPGAKSGDGVVSQGAMAPASSQTPSNGVIDQTLNGPAATAAPVQAVMAAAIAQGTSGPSADTVLQGVAAAKDAPAGAPVVALVQASAATSAAVTAATAASIAQEVSSSAGTGAADKRAHANSPDLSLAGASNDGSAGATQLLTSNTSTDGNPLHLKVAAGVDTAGFGQGVADKVSVMMDANLTSAKLQVNPPALGPIEVRIALQGGHAQVWLSSHSAVTRDALESSSPKLREMLGSQGFSQVSVDISHRSFQDRSPPSQAYEAMPSIKGDAPVLAQASASISRNAIGLLDAYA
jgi:flagellar hook-length control protein FliK